MNTHRIAQLLTVLAVGFLVFVIGRSVAVFLIYNGTLINFPYSVDYGEGPVLDQVMRLAHFENIYPADISHPPYIVGNYPPVYQLLQVPLAWCFGPAFWYGRTINLISLLAAALFIGASLYRLTGDRLASLVGGAMLPVFPYIFKWSGFVRVDSLALGLSWAALYLVIRAPDRRKSLIASALLFTAAVYTRQSYVMAGPVTAIAWLLSQKLRKRSLELILWIGSLSLTLFLIINAVTDGGFFFHIITSNVNLFMWDTVLKYWQEMRYKLIYLIIGSLVFVLFGFRSLQKTWWVGTPYFITAVLSGLTIGKLGSNVNYLFEFSAAMAFMAGALLAWPGTGRQGGKWVGARWHLKLIMVILLAFQITGIYRWSRDDYSSWEMDRVAEDREDLERMVQLAASAERPVLADEFMGSIVLGGKSLVFQPFEFRQLSIFGVWDQSRFVKAISEKEFDYIFIFDPPGWDFSRNRWTPNQLYAIKSSYYEKEILADTRILAPRRPSVPVFPPR